MSGCRSDRSRCVQGLNLHYYLTNSIRLPSLEGNGYMNRDNYQRFAQPYAPLNGVPYVNVYSFTLPASSTGFYIAVQDNGTCMAIQRLRVNRNNCKAQQVGLVLYPDAPAPENVSVDINVSCVPNAEFTSESSRIATCTDSGEWGSVYHPICHCRLGYQETADHRCRGE